MSEQRNQHAAPPATDAAEKLEQEIAEEKREMKEVTAFTVLASVFRAWFGVQTEENRQRDFNANKPAAFIVAGIIFAVFMVIGVIIMVNIALSSAGQ